MVKCSPVRAALFCMEIMKIMMKLKEYKDSRYRKIAFYAVITIVVSFVLCMILSLSGGFFRKLFDVIGLVLKPIIYGGIIAYLLEPAVQKFEKLFRGKSARPLAVAVTLVLILLLAAGTMFFIGSVVKDQVSGIRPDDFSSMITSFDSQINEIKTRVQTWLSENTGLIGESVGKVTGWLSSASGAASTLLFSVIFAIYFLLDSENIGSYWMRVINLLFSERSRKKVREILFDADHCFSAYIRGKFLDAVLVFAMISVAMLIYRIPYPFVIGIFTAVGNLIPFVGPIGGIIALLVICLSESLMSKFVIGALILIVLMQIDANIFNPKLVSSSISIHPLLVFSAMIAGGAIGGVAGMLVSAPIAALLKIEFDKYIERKEKEKAEAGQPEAGRD